MFMWLFDGEDRVEGSAELEWFSRNFQNIQCHDNFQVHCKQKYSILKVSTYIVQILGNYELSMSFYKFV